MTPTDFMFLVGVILITGFIADWLSRRKYIPDSIVLILLGMLLGHVTGILPPSDFLSFAGFMASIAVAVILYDTGLHLNIFQTIRESPKAFVIATVSYVLSSVFIAVSAHLMLGWDVFSSILTGAMLGGTSAAIVASIIEKLPVPDRTKVLLNIESTLTNAYALVIVLSLISFYTGETAVDPVFAVKQMISSLSVSILLGFLGGVIWLYMFSRLNNYPYARLLTLSVMFLLYALVEYLGGVGAIASFVFGLVLGNSSVFREALLINKRVGVGHYFKSFSDEISFFIRVFFFVFLGVIFVPPEEPAFYVVAVLITALALIARYASSVLVKPEGEEIVVVSIPRGLSEAVVASLLISLSYPLALEMLQLTSLVILFTNIATALGVYYISSLYKRSQTDNVSDG